MSRTTPPRRRRWWLWVLAAVLALVIGVLAAVVLPIVLHRSEGLSHQQPSDEEWPTTVTAIGDDGRTRSLSVAGPEGQAVDTSALRVGDRLVVSGAGFDAGTGIYVAVCVIPDSPEQKPGPCVGGAPQQTQDPAEHAGEVQWAVSNWVNDDWAWRLFGSRPFDDAAAGTFTAYLEIMADGVVDCRVERCGIVTRNDHTAAADRVQDVYLPIGLAD